MRGIRKPQVTKELKTKGFNCCRNDAVSFAVLSVSGNMFQTVDAALRNHLAPECFLFLFVCLCAYSPNKMLTNPRCPGLPYLRRFPHPHSGV